MRNVTGSRKSPNETHDGTFHVTESLIIFFSLRSDILYGEISFEFSRKTQKQ